MSTIFVRFRSLMSKITQHPALKEMFFIYDIYDAMLIFLLKIWACQDISYGLKNLKFLQTMIFTNLTLGGDYKIPLGQDDILSGLVASRWCYYLFIKYIDYMWKESAIPARRDGSVFCTVGTKFSNAIVSARQTGTKKWFNTCLQRKI